MSPFAIIGIVIGVLTLCFCLSCGGFFALNWSEFKKGFDEGFKKEMERQKQQQQQDKK